MMQPDFEGAKDYALGRLARELAPHLVYHSVGHTRDDVVPAVERLATMLGINGEASVLLRTAAHFHDIGFVKCRAEHEALGVAIASAALPHFGYTFTQVRAIGGMIMATKLPQAPHTSLEKLLADADLDVLGRTDFLMCNLALYQELRAEGQEQTLREWYQHQHAFLQHHCYWTAAARSLHDQQKQQNVVALTELIG